MLIPSKDEVAANVDLARRRSRVAAFAVLKSVSLRSAVGFTVEKGLIRVAMPHFSL
jgi:hypothetical protein